MFSSKAFIRYGLVACLVLAGVASGAALAWYALHDARRVEAWLERSLERPVSIGGVHVSWAGWGPRIEVHHLDVYDKSGSRSVLHFDALRAELHLPYMLSQFTPGPSELTVAGANLTLARGADGRISVAGFAAKDADADAELAKRWAAKQRRLRIQARELQWQDATGATPPFGAQHVELQLSNDGARHQIDISGHLDAAPFKAALDVRGDLFTPSGWSGAAYLQASGMHLPSWVRGHLKGDWRLGDGEATLYAWGELAGGKLTSVRGRGRLTGLRLQGAHAPFALQRLAGVFDWRAEAGGWRLALNDLHLTRPGTLPRPTSLSARWRGGDAGQMEFIFAELPSAPLLDLARASGAASPAVMRALADLAPAARLTHGYARYRPRTGDLLVQTEAKDVSTRPWRGVPGVSGLNAKVTLSRDAGVLELDGSAARLDFAGLFRAPLEARALSGAFAWSREADGWRLHAPDIRAHNADLRLRAHFRMSVPHGDESPYMDLVVGFGDGDGRHTSRYLPVGIMSKAVVGWLDRAIVAGHVTGGGAVVRGPLKEFPFDAGTGRFEVRFNVSDGILDYAEGWPRLEEIETEVAFVGRRLEISGYAAKIFAADVSDTRVEIADLSAHPAVVKIHGVARGDASDGLRYLLESPLYLNFGAYLSGGRASGASRVELDLALPLDHTPAKLDAEVHFGNATLSLDHVDLTGLQGILHISEQGLSASAIAAHVLGQPATMAVRTDAGPQGGTVFSAQGRFAAASLARRWPSTWWTAVTGEAAWRGSLSLPRAAPGARVAAMLRIESTLGGIALSLPEPLNKTASETLPFKLETRLPLNAEAATTVQWGTRASASLAWRKGARGPEPAGGALRFGAGSAPPATPDLWKTSGELTRFSWAAWSPWVAAPADAAAGAAPARREVDLRVRALEVFGQRYADVHVDARRTPGAWEMRLAGRQLAGTVTAPHSAGATVRAELETLRIAAPAEGGAASQSGDIDPRTLPPLEVHARHFWYGDAELGALQLRASRGDAGLRFDEVQLSSPFWQVRGSGEWRRDGNHFSRTAARVEATDLGAALGALGYAGTLSGGKGHLDVNARWNGPPSAFSLARLNGNLRLDLEKGYLLEVEPGAGRLFGLLSPQALPRRLSLDFGDFFRKGLAFDRIRGDFRIENGNAYTDNLTMDGPAARVEVSGRIGLGARDYDQLAAVTPHLTGGLPIAGAVVGGVGVGAAVFVLERLLKPQIDQMTRVRYSIKGDWDAAQVERVAKDATP